MPEAPRFLDCGEAALSVEFGDAVDPAINARVLALDDALRAAPPPGMRETTPTYRALFIRYEPLEISRGALIAVIRNALATGATCPPLPKGEGPGVRGARDDALRAYPLPNPFPQAGRAADSARQQQSWIIPCCYDAPLAEDVDEAASLLTLTTQQLAAQHAAAEHRACMYGFAPGWLYLGSAPASLRIARRAHPRGPTPQGAVLIGGGLSLIAANPMPTGWYVIGRTPERMFSLARAPHFLIAPGDAIRFEAIDAATFAALDARAASGEIVARREAP